MDDDAADHLRVEAVREVTKIRMAREEQVVLAGRRCWKWRATHMATRTTVQDLAGGVAQCRQQVGRGRVGRITCGFAEMRGAQRRSRGLRGCLGSRVSGARAAELKRFGSPRRTTWRRAGPLFPCTRMTARPRRHRGRERVRVLICICRCISTSMCSLRSICRTRSICSMCSIYVV